MTESRSRWLWLWLVLGLALAVQAQETDSGAVGSELWVGIMMTDAVDGGSRLAAVIPGGPAERSGLLAGDILIRIDEEPVSGRESIRSYLRERGDSGPVSITFLRNGKTQQVSVYPERRRRMPAIPSEFTTSFNVRPSVNIRITSMTPELRQHYGAPIDRGLLLLKVEREGAAAEAGLQVGDILLEACGGALDTEQSWNRCLQRSVQDGELAVLRLRDGERETRTLKLPRLARVRFAPLMESLAASDEMRVRRREMLEIEIQRLKSMLVELQSEYERLADDSDSDEKR
jgi:S1-C subfamily serine protease